MKLLLLLLLSEYTGVVLSAVLANGFCSPSFYVPIIAGQLSPHVFQHTLCWSASCPERVGLIARTFAPDRWSGVRRKSRSKSKGRTLNCLLRTASKYTLSPKKTMSPKKTLRRIYPATNITAAVGSLFPPAGDILTTHHFSVCSIEYLQSA